MRRPFIAGNWKLNLGPSDAAVLAEALKPRLAERGAVTVAVFPTALSIHTVIPALHGSGIGVGVQDIETQATGAWTGTNSGSMARELGCTYALIGHSERRQHYGETDARVNARVGAALQAGLLPIVCVGERLDERRAGRAEDVVCNQLEGALQGLTADQIATLTLAYEPVWAIGTGETASPEQAQAIHAQIRTWLSQRTSPTLADQIRIQYGGSVKPANAADLLGCPDIDGALVGGASLKADSFGGIIDAAAALLA